MKTKIAAALCLLYLFGAPMAMAEKTIRLTFAGDVTLGSEEAVRNEPDSFDAYANQYGNDYFFEKVKPLFDQDDLTIVNLEGVLSDSAEGENQNKTYRFRGPTHLLRFSLRAALKWSIWPTTIQRITAWADIRIPYARWMRSVDHFGGEETAILKDGIKIAFMV